jgi:hypothetical protein
MTTKCEKCGVSYDDSMCWTICPHKPFINEEAAKRKDLAFSLTGKNLQFREPLRIQSIDGWGYITLRGIEGTFEPSQLDIAKE